MRRDLVRLLHDDNGVTAIEYSLIATFIAMVMIAGATLIGINVLATFNNVAASF